jgi:hypothetical protein
VVLEVQDHLVFDPGETVAQLRPPLRFRPRIGEPARWRTGDLPTGSPARRFAGSLVRLGWPIGAQLRDRVVALLAPGALVVKEVLAELFGVERELEPLAERRRRRPQARRRLIRRRLAVRSARSDRRLGRDVDRERTGPVAPRTKRRRPRGTTPPRLAPQEVVRGREQIEQRGALRGGQPAQGAGRGRTSGGRAEQDG